MNTQQIATSGKKVSTQTINNDVEIMRAAFVAKLNNADRLYVLSLSPDQFLAYRQAYLMQQWSK